MLATRYVVSGSTKTPSRVSLNDHKHTCACPDHMKRQNACKHIKFVLMSLGLDRAAKKGWRLVSLGSGGKPLNKKQQRAAELKAQMAMANAPLSVAPVLEPTVDATVEPSGTEEEPREEEAAAAATTEEGVQDLNWADEVTASGKVTGDTVVAAEEYNSKNVADATTMGVKSGYTIKDALGADMSANYVVTSSGTASGQITQAALSLTPTAATKVYDGNEYNAKTVADATTVGVKTGYTIKDAQGADMSANYVITSSATASGQIIQAALSVAGTVTAQDKVYDGTTVAAVTGGGPMRRRGWRRTPGQREWCLS
ncbi:MAG: hypothetical protein WDW38_010550 [Sanguina aurantia]